MIPSTPGETARRTSALTVAIALQQSKTSCELCHVQALNLNANLQAQDGKVWDAILKFEYLNGKDVLQAGKNAREDEDRSATDMWGEEDSKICDFGFTREEAESQHQSHQSFPQVAQWSQVRAHILGPRSYSYEPEPYTELQAHARHRN